MLLSGHTGPLIPVLVGKYKTHLTILAGTRLHLFLLKGLHGWTVFVASERLLSSFHRFVCNKNLSLAHTQNRQRISLSLPSKHSLSLSKPNNILFPTKHTYWVTQANFLYADCSKQRGYNKVSMLHNLFTASIPTWMKQFKRRLCCKDCA